MFRSLPAALGSLAITLALAWGASVVQDKPTTVKFDHADHVYAGWSNREDALKLSGRQGETKRDCRGCHVYDSAGPDLAPASRCLRCHDPDRFWEQDPETQQRIDTSKSKVDPALEARGGFQHAHHLEKRDKSGNVEMIDCAQCHYARAKPGSRTDWQIVLPAQVAGATDGCIGCHQDDTGEKRKRFNAELTRDLEQRAQSAGSRAPPVFSHAAHLEPAELESASRKSCQVCHAKIGEAGAGGLAQSAFDTQSCEVCHTGMSFRRELADAEGRPFTEESPTKLTFSHAQHLGPGKDGAPPLECGKCHAFQAQPAAAGALRTFELCKPILRSSDGRGAFHGCVTCHANLGFEGHGQVDACAECHATDSGALSTDAAKASNRPREEVRRVDAQSFTFGLQSHVFIAEGRTENAPKKCAECHLAKLAELPSRIENQPFRHATHLAMGAEPGSRPLSDAACRQCHQAVASAKSLKDFETAFDLSACHRCHGRTAPTPIPEEHPRTTALRFDHAKHVGKQGPDGEAIGCVACHTPDSMTLAEPIHDCRTCHRHPDAAEKTINRFTKATVKSCAFCHAAGVPEKGAPVPAPRARLVAAREGYQRHDGEQPCSKCHVLGRSDSGAFGQPDPRPASTEITVATRSRYGTMRNPHRARLLTGDRADVRDMSATQAAYFFEQVSCAECHWSNPTRCTNSRVAEALEHADTPAWVKETLRGEWKKDARKRVGGELGGQADYPEGFPGVIQKP